LSGGVSAMLEDEGVVKTDETTEEVVMPAAYDFEGAVVVLLKQTLQFLGLVTPALSVIVGEMRRSTVSGKTVNKGPDGDDGENES
jgi:hypothetical protein